MCIVLANPVYHKRNEQCLLCLHTHAHTHTHTHTHTLTHTYTHTHTHAHTHTHTRAQVRGRLTIQEGTTKQYNGIYHAATVIVKEVRVQGLLNMRQVPRSTP